MLNTITGITLFLVVFNTSISHTDTNLTNRGFLHELLSISNYSSVLHAS